LVPPCQKEGTFLCTSMVMIEEEKMIAKSISNDNY